MYDLKFKWLWLGLGLALVALILVLSLAPLSSLPNVHSNDKFLHFIAYFFIACWFSGIVLKRNYLLLGVILLAFSYAIELLQGLSRYRQFEWYDLMANGSGIFVALLFGVIFLKGWCQFFENKFLIK